MIFAIIAGILILALAGGSYYMFASVFDMKRYVHEDPDPATIDTPKDLMRPTAHKLYAFEGPYIDRFDENPFEDIYITSFDGLKLHGYLLKGRKDEVVICAHGYKSSPQVDYADKMEMYKRRGSTILLVDMRAHGKSEGRYLGFSELDKYDLKSWADRMSEMYGSPRIYLHGISMGGASVIHTADMHIENLKGIIDDCGYNTIDDIVRELVVTNYGVPYFPLAPLAELWAKALNHVGFRDSIGEEIVKCGEVPIVFIHGLEDHFVPCWMSQKMYDSCTGPKEILLVEGCGHAAAYCCATKEYTALVNKLLDGEIR